MCTRRDQFLEDISIDPAVCFGKPVIKGTRIWVSLILDFLSNGKSYEEILSEYPQLAREDILACIDYDAEAASERLIEEPVASNELSLSAMNTSGLSCITHEIHVSYTIMCLSEATSFRA